MLQRQLPIQYVMLKLCQQCGITEPIRTLPEKGRGRPLLLGKYLDKKLQLCVKKVKEGNAVVSSKVVMAAACGILKVYGRHAEAGLEDEEAGSGLGYIRLNRHWAYSFLRRLNYVKRKATTAKSKYSVADFSEIKVSFLRLAVETVTMEEIPPGLILNWDQTRMTVLSSPWMMHERGTTRVQLTGNSYFQDCVMLLSSSDEEMQRYNLTVIKY